MTDPDARPALRAVLAGGGTAGHVEPALALAEALLREDPRCEVTLLGTAAGLEARLVPARGFHLETIPKVALPRRPSADLLTVPTRLRTAVLQAEEVLDRHHADVVVGFGGYVSLPAYLAARRRGTAIVVHEANVRPGLANRIGARLTRFVAVSHASASLPGCVVVGIPLRPRIRSLDRAQARPAARRDLGLAEEGPVLLVSGGSQGARRLNEAALGAAARLVAAGVQVLHAAGPHQYADVAASLPPDFASRYHVVPYIDDMPAAYAAADLMLCRAGAMTCAELAAVGLPAAYVPLPIGNGEQRLNAEPVVDAGGGLLVDDDALTSDWVVSALLPLLSDAPRLTRMSEAARRASGPDAAAALVRMVHDAVESRRGGGRGKMAE